MDGVKGCLNDRGLTIPEATECVADWREWRRIIGGDVDDPGWGRLYETVKVVWVEPMLCMLGDPTFLGKCPYCWKKCIFSFFVDYEKAAAHIHRFLSMDETILRHSADSANKGLNLVN